MRAAIIDDSRLARKELAFMLKAFNTIEIIWEAQDADSAITQIEETRPDVIFLDIQMPGKSGFELLEELEYTPQVIFTTAYDEYAFKALDYNALDYLLKPVKENRLQTALEKIKTIPQQAESTPEEKKLLGENDQVFVKDGEDCWFVKLKDIRLFEIEGNYSRIHFDKNSPLIPKTLNYLETRLDPEVFFRTNRQQIINLKHIKEVKPWFSGTFKIILQNSDKEIELSRRQSVAFKEKMSF